MGGKDPEGDSAAVRGKAATEAGFGARVDARSAATCRRVDRVRVRAIFIVSRKRRDAAVAVLTDLSEIPSPGRYGGGLAAASTVTTTSAAVRPKDLEGSRRTRPRPANGKDLLARAGIPDRHGPRVARLAQDPRAARRLLERVCHRCSSSSSRIVQKLVPGLASAHHLLEPSPVRLSDIHRPARLPQHPFVTVRFNHGRRGCSRTSSSSVHHDSYLGALGGLCYKSSWTMHV